jgi:3-oxoacyl-[acyl-carrier protein] reductase
MNKPVCIVSGSSSGIGAATVLYFAQRGYDVVVNYSREPGPAQAVAHACEALGAQALLAKADVSQAEQCDALAEQVKARFGRADVLVNNAARTQFVTAKNLRGLSAQDFNDVFSLNVAGMFMLSRAFEPLLQHAPKPSITNVSSAASQSGGGSSIAYACSKGAVNSLTLCLAKTLAPKIRVNAVLPGVVNTPWLRRGLGDAGYEQAVARYKQHSALAQIIEPEDVAAAIWYLAIDAVKTTGHLMPVEAGALTVRS